MPDMSGPGANDDLIGIRIDAAAKRKLIELIPDDRKRAEYLRDLIRYGNRILESKKAG